MPTTSSLTAPAEEAACDPRTSSLAPVLAELGHDCAGSCAAAVAGLGATDDVAPMPRVPKSTGAPRRSPGRDAPSRPRLLVDDRS